MCKNCISSGRTCTGYQRKYAFVLAKQMSSGTGHSTGHQLANVRDTESGLVLCSRWGVKPPSPAAARTSAASLSWSSSKATRASVDAAEQARRRKATCFPSCLIPNRLLHDGLFSLFLQSDTSHDQSIHLVFGERQDWIRQIIDLPNLQPVLRDGVLAVCTARLGRHVSRPDLVYESRRLYTKTLSGMQRGLLDVSMRQNVEVLAASLALLLYEVTECPGKSTDGYRAHYLGMMNLLRLRGPVAHKSGLAHSVFQVLRLHAVSATVPDYGDFLPRVTLHEDVVAADKLFRCSKASLISTKLSYPSLNGAEGHGQTSQRTNLYSTSCLIFSSMFRHWPHKDEL